MAIFSKSEFIQLKEPDIIQSEYTKRMHEILDQSWKIFKSQFINKRHEIETEAPFQHHLAYIIRSVGELYSLDKKDLFKVDLEKKSKTLEAVKSSLILPVILKVRSTV